MPEPKWVISMGVCAVSGGMFNNYAIVQGVDHIVPVDIYLPGCPPRPEMLLNAILKLHEQIQNTPLGVNRVEAARAAEEAALTATPTHADEGPAARERRSDRRRRRQGRRRRRAEDADARPSRRAPTRPSRACRRRPDRSRADVVGVRHGMFGAPTAATPPATAAWSRAVLVARRRRRARTAASSTRSPTRLERALVGGRRHLRRRRRAGRRRPRRDDLLRARASTCSPWPARCATTRRCASRCAPASAACTTRSETGRELHAVYHLLSITHDAAGPPRGHRAPTPTRTSRRSSSVYPANDWHERETWDIFGIVFDGHPALTRILMPDDWPGHPQRKDYPLGGIPVEYKGATIPPPDQRRSYS